LTRRRPPTSLPERAWRQTMYHARPPRLLQTRHTGSAAQAQEKRGDMSARTVLASGTEPVVQVFDGAFPPRQSPRQPARPASSGTSRPTVRRTLAESRVADL